MNLKSVIVFLIILFYNISSANSQSDSKKSSTVDTSAFDLAFAKDQNTSLPLSITYSKSLEDKVDSMTKLDMLKTEVNYHKYMFTQRIALYNWQLNSGKILFFVVVFIVLIGLYLSYLQFKASTAHQENLRANRGSVTTVTTNADNLELPSTKLEISKEGIKIDSAVIGLVILVISIAFFFMYLRYVFPIQTPGN